MRIDIIFLIDDFLELPVYDVGASGDTQYRKNHDQNAFSMQPAIQIQPDEKTETNAAGHGQPDLHDNG